MKMETLIRIEQFELARDLLVRELLQGLLTPEVFEQLGKELADYYCAMVARDENKIF